MAMLSHRLRRVLIAVPSCLQRSFTQSRTSNFPSATSLISRSVVKQSTRFDRSQAKFFSTATTSQYQYDPYTGEDSFTPDNEGCDFNHWLITMDFPKDNPPSREEMISTFEQTCAKGLGISLEEAKERMYAICTTSYQGFQATMTIGEVEKFRDLPGVQYIIPDSYVDVENKVYGGDKYENGVITPGLVPVPTTEGFEAFEKKSKEGEEQAQGSQAPSNEGRVSRQVQDQGTQIPPDQRSVKQGQDQESRMSISGQGLGRGQGSQMQTPKQGRDRGLRSQWPTPKEGRDRGPGSQMPSFQRSSKQGQGTLPPGQSQAQGSHRTSLQENYNGGQGTPIQEHGTGQGSQIPAQRSFGQGQTIPTPGQGNQATSYQVGYSQGQGAQTPPYLRKPSNQGPPQGKFMQETQEYFNQVGRRNYIPQSDGSHGSAQGVGSPGFGHGYGQGRGDPLLSPYQGSYNHGPMPLYQGNYNQGTPYSYGQWVFVNYHQGEPYGNFLQGPLQNGGHYGPAQFGQVYPGHAPCPGSYMPQYQLSYNQLQGTPFPGQWHCQRCGMPSYQGNYIQGPGTPFPRQWQGQFQTSYSQAQRAPGPPFERNYNQGIPTSYGQGTSAHFHQGIPVNYNQMGQGDHSPHSNGPSHRAAQNPGFQQEDQRNVASDRSNKDNPLDPTEARKVPH